MKLIGLSSSASGASSTVPEVRASIADSAAETSSAGAVSVEGVTSKATGTAQEPADCCTSFVSAPIFQVRAPMANVTTAAQAATAPASAYKTPVLVGKRATLAYPLAAAAISKMRLRTKIRIDIRPSMPTFLLKSQQVCGARWERAK